MQERRVKSIRNYNQYTREKNLVRIIRCETVSLSLSLLFSSLLYINSNWLNREYTESFLPVLLRSVKKVSRVSGLMNGRRRNKKRQEEVSWVQPLDVMNSTPSPSLLFPTKLCVSLSKEKNHSQDEEDEEEDEKEGGGWKIRLNAWVTHVKDSMRDSFTSSDWFFSWFRLKSLLNFLF